MGDKATLSQSAGSPLKQLRREQARELARALVEAERSSALCFLIGVHVMFCRCFDLQGKPKQSSTETIEVE